MPISDLLASITGEKPTATSSARPTNGTGGISGKRKAEDDAGTRDQKAPRIATTANGSSRPGSNASKPTNQVERSSSGYTGSARPTPTTNTPRSLNDRPVLSATKKASLASGTRPSPTPSSLSRSTRPAAAPASSVTKQPSVAVPTPAPDPNAKAPKKGSYAEIKARAAAASSQLQTIGKIQHKAIEKAPVKAPTKQELQQAQAEAARLAKKGIKPGPKLAAVLAARNGSNGAHANGNGTADRAKGLGQKGLNVKSGKDAAADERKLKKAALATTGYTGSARAPPSKAKPGAARPSAPEKDRGRDKQPNPMGMFGSRRPKNDDDYDEDMDDFVVDDEEEEEAYGYGAPRYKYADEDDDSDMEAGYTDMEVEDSRALRLARIEDEREEAILARRKQEKEKKKALLQRRR